MHLFPLVFFARVVENVSQQHARVSRSVLRSLVYRVIVHKPVILNSSPNPVFTRVSHLARPLAMTLVGITCRILALNPPDAAEKCTIYRTRSLCYGWERAAGRDATRGEDRRCVDRGQTVQLGVDAVETASFSGV